MIELIPALLVQTRDEFEERVRVIEPFAPIAQIDVLDGSWLGAKSWADTIEISHIKSQLHFELHLMVANPVAEMEKWAEIPSVKRVIFHIETVERPLDAIEAARFYGWECGVALNPDTPLETVEKILEYIDEILFLTVQPGAGGRTFEKNVLKKIASLAARPKHPIIGADGAMNPETIPMAIKSGATRIIVNTALFNAEMPVAETWRRLLQCTNYV